MKIMNKMMWMGAGIGLGVFYKTYERDICDFVNKQRNKMMKIESALIDDDSSN